jgi:hypothetical protein
MVSKSQTIYTHNTDLNICVLSCGGLGDQSAAPALLPSPSWGRFLVTELNPRNVRFGLRYPDFVKVWDI